MRQAFETRRNYLYERMSAIPGVHPVRPEATFYMLMNLDGLIGKTLYGDVIHDADDFARVFLREGLVAVVPCTASVPPTTSAGPSPSPWRTSRKAWTGWRSSSRTRKFRFSRSPKRADFPAGKSVLFPPFFGVFLATSPFPSEFFYAILSF